jgi:hypothetical protein
MTKYFQAKIILRNLERKIEYSVRVFIKNKAIKKKPFFRLPPKKVRHFWGYFMERKVKYDYAFKLECVKLVLEKHYSCNYVSNQRTK